MNHRNDRGKPVSPQASAPPELPVLIVQHAPHEHPATFLRALETQGVQTLWIKPYQGDPYPNAREIRGMISLGGPMGANDEAAFPWITQECALLRHSVEAQLPTVGVCLGAQMMAKALGGKVERHSKYEIGWFPIELNEDGKADPILSVAGDAPMVYQWHEDTFHLPPKATLLAGSKACPRQAYRISNHAYGFQFHPEADHQLVHEWLAVEGIETEILEIQKQFGPRTVQVASTQRNRATKGEKSSLKIVIAITSLFRHKEGEPRRQELRDRISKWTTRRRNISVNFENSQKKIGQLNGKITGFLELAFGDYLLLQDSNSTVWPIRTDDILEIKLLP